MSFSAEVWQKLSEINVSDKVESKNGLTYLSWAWAWGVLMELYPESEYKFLDDNVFSDSSLMVNVEVTVKEGDKSVSRQMWLPVIDYKNKAISNPNAMNINTTRMRCLTKCLAMFGLGHYIYAGEDLPNDKYDSVQVEYINPDQATYINDLLNETGSDIEAFTKQFLKVASVDKIPAKQYQLAVKALEKKRDKMEKSA